MGLSDKGGRQAGQKGAFANGGLLYVAGGRLGASIVSTSRVSFCGCFTSERSSQSLR